jgi:hypothetical protein
MRKSESNSDYKQVSVKIPREIDQAQRGEKCFFNLGNQQKSAKAVIHQQEFSFEQATKVMTPKA